MAHKKEEGKTCFSVQVAHNDTNRNQHAKEQSKKPGMQEGDVHKCTTLKKGMFQFTFWICENLATRKEPKHLLGMKKRLMLSIKIKKKKLASEKSAMQNSGCSNE